MMAKHATLSRRRLLPALLATVLAVSLVTTEALRQHAGAHTADAASEAIVALIASSEAAQARAQASASVEASDAAASASAASAASATAAKAAASAAQVAAITSLAAGRSADAISVAALNTSTGASYSWAATGGMNTRQHRQALHPRDAAAAGPEHRRDVRPVSNNRDDDDREQ